jgi:F-type H+-transporting ATPase subunit gamma
MFTKLVRFQPFLPKFFPIVHVQAQIPCNSIATLRDLKVRLKTIHTIKKITSSMKSVAASKLKQAERAKDQVQPFLKSVRLLLKDVPVPASTNDMKQVFVPMTSDRGLCGSANSSIIRFVDKTAKVFPRDNLTMYCIGDKSRIGISRNYKARVIAGVSNLGKKALSFMELVPFSELVVKAPADKLSLVSNRYINSITFEVRNQELPSKPNVVAKVDDIFKGYEIDGEEKEIMSDMYDFFVHSIIYCSIIENFACELSSRMTSMDNATRNASEMTIKLNLDVNRKRQSGITKELTEIVSGAAAVEEGIEW